MAVPALAATGERMDAEATLRERTGVFEMPGHLLRRCQQIAVALFLKECAAFDLTPLQYAALATLAEYGAMDQATLARHAALDRTTAAVVVRNLARRGLVSKTASHRDRRASLIALTGQGRRLRRQAAQSVAAMQARLLAPLNRRERATFVRLLARIAEENNALSRAPMRR